MKVLTLCADRKKQMFGGEGTERNVVASFHLKEGQLCITCKFPKVYRPLFDSLAPWFIAPRGANETSFLKKLVRKAKIISLVQQIFPDCRISVQIKHLPASALE